MTDTTKSDVGFLEQFEPDVFWEKHGRKIVWIAGAVLALGFVVFLQQRHKAQEEETAALRLAEARDVGALQSIIRDYPGKNVAAAALIRLGDGHYRSGNYDDAARIYKELLTEYPGHPLVQSARFGLAAVQEAQGNFLAAKEQYLQLASSDPNGYLLLAAGLGAARCAEALGQAREARQMYEELLAASRGSPLQTECFVRWKVLSRGLPTETAAATNQTAAAPTAPLPPVAPLPAPSAAEK